VAGRSGKSNVYAFEPHPYTFALLKENIALNHQDDNILCYQMALSDKNGILLFRDAPGDPENHILNESASMDGTIEVKSSRGDAFSIQKGLTPQVIKIDVEGHENHVLAGFSSVLESVQLIFVECWEIEQTVQHLCDKAGFLGPYKIDYRNRQFIHDNIHHEDWVFVNPAAVDVLNQRMFFK